MDNTLADLNRSLDDLESRLPAMLAMHSDHGEFWCAFAGEADAIEDRAGPHAGAVTQRLEAMLAKHGRYLAYADLPACNEDEHRLAMDSEPRALASSPAESSDLVEPTWMHQPRAMAQRMVDATNRTMKREHDHDPSCES